MMTSSIGDDCHLGAHVVCGPRVRLGARVVVKAGAVLGGTGFGFHSSAAGHQRIPHVGGLVIGDDVEIGSLCSIDCGSIDDTVIERGTKVDNMVHVGHNVRIGEHCLLAGGVLVGGSTRLGSFVVIGGGAGLGDHVTIGDGARIGAGTGVFRDVPAGAVVSGYIGAEPSRDAPGAGRIAAASRRSSPSSSGSWRSAAAMPRRTLAREVTLTGVALHSGVTSSVVCRPAPAGQGITFAQHGGKSAAVPARPHRVGATERRTGLGEGDDAIYTVEHLLAAAFALGLDDIAVEVDGPELPILDGSFEPWLEALAIRRGERRPGSAGDASWCGRPLY